MLGLLAAAGIMAVLIAVACCKRSGDLSEQEEAGEQEPPPARNGLTIPDGNCSGIPYRNESLKAGKQIQNQR